MIDRKPLASIIVTSYALDRLPDLTALLDSLSKQTFTDSETIVVIERSDELYRRVGEYVSKNGYTDVRLLFNSGRCGASSARNLAIRNAQGEILSFIDDDAVATTSWLAEIVDTLRNNDDAIGVTGPILPLWEDDRLKWLPEEFYWLISCAPPKSELPYRVRNAWGNNMSFRKEAFEKSGLFLSEVGARGGGNSGKHELIGEDTEFSLRARKICGKNIICSPGVIIYHRASAYRFSNIYIATRSYWEGYTKMLMKRAFRGRYSAMLSVENKLLGRILFRLIPSTLAGMLTKPTKSWQRLKLVTIGLSGVAFGYLRGMFGNAEIFGREACIEYL